MKKLIVIANLGRIRPVKFKPAGDDPQDQAHLFEDPGSTLEIRPQSIHEVVTDQAGRFRQSGPLNRQGGTSGGEEHHLKSELEHQALERVAGKIGEIVAAALVLPFGADPEKTIQSTIAFCKEQLGSQLTPKRIFLVDELPRSDAGKLYRSRLVQRFTGM